MTFGISILVLFFLVSIASSTQDLDSWNNKENILNKYFSLESYNYPGEFIRHANYLGEKIPINSQLDQMDSTFTLRLGLADQQDVSFESYNYPDIFSDIKILDSN